MPDLYLPSEKAHDLIRSLNQGFWAEIDDEGIVTFLFKYEPSILTKLIHGCKIQIVIRNPKLSPRSLTVYIYDNPVEPFFNTHQEFGEEDKNYIGFDEVTIQLAKSDKIRVAYFNYQNAPIFTTTLPIKSDFSDFNKWIQEIYSDTNPVTPIENGIFHPESRQKGYLIDVTNKDSSQEEKMTIHMLDFKDDTPENFQNASYNFNDFLGDGKHGYNQELSFESHLKKYFDEKDEIFVSPLKTNGNELIDFLVYYKKATLLIESKFVLSTKQTKLNRAISKAIQQLNLAENIIKNDLSSIQNERDLHLKLSNNEIIIRICLFNDSLTMDEKSCRNVIQSNRKSDLPIFISVTTFFQLLGEIKDLSEDRFKFNLIQNLYNIYYEFLDNENRKILIIRTFEAHSQNSTNS